MLLCVQKGVNGMRYFECKASLEKELKPRSDEYIDACNELGDICQTYCDTNNNGFSVFVVNLRGKKCNFVFAGNGSDDMLKSECKAIWDSFGLEGMLESISEVSSGRIKKYFRHSHDVDEPEDIEELMRIDEIRFVELDEFIVDPDEQEDLADYADSLCMTDLSVESKRIDACSSNKFIGHPVHYLFEDNSTDNARKSAYVLIGKLLKAKRLESGRTVFLTDKTILRKHGDVIKATYGNLSGGTLIVSLNTSRTESEYADVSEEMIKDICDHAKKYRNEILTIFHIHHNDKKAENTIDAYLDEEIPIIKIREASVGRDESQKILSKFASDKGIDDISGIMEKLDPDITEYYTSELASVFESYYSEYLRMKMYPAYAKCCNVKEIVKEAEGKAAADLAEMIGLSAVKDVINRSVNYFKLQKEYKERNIVLDNPARSMIFTGNPGTAKTTVARLTAKIFRENGLLETGKLIEVGRADLVGQFVGWTAVQVKTAFKKAKGSILFIDEAYSLVDDRDGCFGDEAINTIVQEMENHREDTIVIFAGYPDKMEQFLAKNPGLRSRIAFHVDFPDYNENELLEIFKLMAANKNLRLSKKALEKSQNIFREAVKINEFGNGRFVRNLLESATMGMAQRLANKNIHKLTAKQLTTIEAEDFDMPVMCSKVETQKRRIGF